MEDAISLSAALDRCESVQQAFAEYEAERRPVVQSTQRVAEVSLKWFEETERIFGTMPPEVLVAY